MKYSITIPAYKAKFLRKCIDSILAQTFDDFELIIVNDASPEDLDSIVNSYSDKRIKYYTNEVNCGAVNVVDNWNKCLSYASGDYIICMGDDDELSPDCLEQYNLLMEQYPDLDLYHGRVKLIDEESKLVTLQQATPAYESVYSMIWHRLKKRLVFIGDYVFKRSTLVSNGGFYKIDLAWGSDNISTYIAALEKGVANTIDPVFFYRVNRLSITSSVNTRLKLKAMQVHHKWTSAFIANNTPSNTLDLYYHEIISRELDASFNRDLIYEITKDIKDSKFCTSRFFYWMKNREEFNATKKDVVKSYALALKAKYLLK